MEILMGRIYRRKSAGETNAAPIFAVRRGGVPRGGTAKRTVAYVSIRRHAQEM